MHELERFIRDVPDFPKPGILFKDITPLVQDARAFRRTIALLEEKVAPHKPDLLLAIESRGFIFGAALALQMGLGLAIARKPGKLPCETDRVSYELEYGSNTIELHKGSVEKGKRVAIVDDLLATGGTARACAKLVALQGGTPTVFAFAIELAFLEGRKLLAPAHVESLLVF